MRDFIRISLAALSIATAGTFALERAQALPVAAVAEGATPANAAEKAAYLYNRRRYCWYPTGWHGAGWYRCGYRLRRGYGWGGGEGWQGWNAPVYRQRPDRGGPGFDRPGRRQPPIGRPMPPGRPMPQNGENPTQKIDPGAPRGGMDRPPQGGKGQGGMGQGGMGQGGVGGGRSVAPAPRGGNAPLGGKAEPRAAPMPGGMGGGKAEPQGGGAGGAPLGGVQGK